MDSCVTLMGKGLTVVNPITKSSCINAFSYFWLGSPMLCIPAGYRGTVNKTQCLARGCCWNSDIKEVNVIVQADAVQNA